MREFRRISTGERGSALLPVLGLIGLITAGAYSVARSADHARKLQTTTRQALALESAMRTADAILRDGAVSAGAVTFAGAPLFPATLVGNPSVAIAEIRLPAPPGAVGRVLMRAGAELSPGLRVQAIRLRNLAFQAGPYYVGELHVEVAREEGLGGPSPAVPRFRIGLYTSAVGAARRVEAFGTPLAPPEVVSLLGCWHRTGMPWQPFLPSSANDDHDPCPGLNILGATYVQDPGLSANMLNYVTALALPMTNPCPVYTVSLNLPFSPSSLPLKRLPRSVVCRRNS